MIHHAKGARLNDAGKQRFATVRMEEIELPHRYDYMAGFNIPDQGALGVCVSEGWRKHFNFIATKRTGHPFSVSARAIFAQARADSDPGDTTDSGLDVSAGAAVLERFYVDEAAYPSTDVQSESDFPEWLEPVPDGFKKTDFLLKGTSSLAQITVQQIKLALFKHGPLVAGSAWLDSWEQIQGNSLAEVIMPATGTSLGGHCTNFVGWDDDLGGIIDANSWSRDWGFRGFALIPYAAIEANVTDVYAAIG